MEEKEKLNDLLYHEETYWKQRAKLFWLEEGDTNTKFFHASATSRKKTNLISCLQSESGATVNDHEGMCRIVKDYFEDVFAKSLNVVIGNSLNASVVLLIKITGWLRR